MATDNRLTEVSHDVDRLHITLCMFRLNNDDEKAKAIRALHDLESLLPCLVPTNSFKIDVKYVADFNRRVVYADVYNATELLKLADMASRKLESTGVHLCGNYDVYNPHLTILKLTRPFCKENNIWEINKYVHHKLRNMTFGKQTVESLRICAVGPERGPDNYYVTLARIDNHLLHVEPSAIVGPMSRNIKEQMAQGIIDEAVGDSLLEGILANKNDYLMRSPEETSYESLASIESSQSAIKSRARGDSFEDCVLRYEEMLRGNVWKSPKVMLILRGLPGSGKSYLGKKMVEECKGERKKSVSVHSADDYFELVAAQSGQAYKFDGATMDIAHNYCRGHVINAMHQEKDVIIVDNTHSQRWEYRVYERIAELCGYKCYVVELECNRDSLRQEYQRRCTHNVNDFVHKEMYARWEHDPQAIMCSTRDLELTMKRFTLDTDRCSKPVLYTALFLDKQSRDLLLKTYPPSLKNVHCDHVTLMHEPSAEHLKNLPVGTPFRIAVCAYVGSENAQVVSIREVETKLCVNEHPHITIATKASFRPGDVGKMLNSCACYPTAELTLTGIVGVKIAINKVESVKCTDAHFFRKVYMNDGRNQPSDIGIEAKSTRSKQQRQQQQLPGDQTDAKENMECEADVDIYNGPVDVVTCLNIFDFDSTLFFTPDPVEGREKYQKLTGTLIFLLIRNKFLENVGRRLAKLKLFY